MKSKELMTCMMLSVTLLFSQCAKIEGNDPQVDEGGIKQELVDAFIQKKQFGIYNENAEAEMTMDLMKHEIIYNTIKKQCIIQNDLLYEVMSAKLSATANEGMWKVELSQNKNAAVSYNMKEVKKDADMTWLWDTQNHIGIILLCE